MVINSFLFILENRGCSMRIKRSIKNKVFLSWVLSYAFISIMPVLIGSFVYVESVNTIGQEVSKVNYMSLKQLKSVVDGKFEELNRTVSNIALNQDIKSLMYLKKPVAAKDILTIRNVQEDLAKFKISNSYINDIYIYINNNNYIFCSDNKYNSDEISDISQREFFIGYDELNSLTHTKNYKYFRILKNDAGNGVIQNKVILIHSLYLNDYNYPMGTLIISLDGDKLINLLKNLELTNQGDVMLVDSKNEFYNTENSEAVSNSISYDLLKRTDATYYEKGKDVDLAVTHIASDALNLEYVSLIPTNVFLDRVQYIKNIIFIYIGICLIAGIIAAFFLAKKNYSPLVKLKQMFISKLGNFDNAESNEFKFLENSLKSLLDENHSIAASLKLQKDALRNNLLVKLLKGRTGSKESVKESLDSYGIQFGSDCFLVVAFCIEDPNRKLLGDHIDNEEAVDMIHFIVKNIAEELLNEKYIGYMADIDGMMVCLVNTRDNCGDVCIQDIFRTDVDGILNKALSFIENKFGILLSAAVSDIHYGIQGIAAAYSETLEVFEFKTLVGEKEIIMRYESIHPNISGCINDSYSLEKERLFANCIKAGDYKDAREILDDLLTNNLKMDIKSIQLAKCRVFGLVNITLNALGEIRNGFDIEFLDGLDPANRLLNTKSITDLKMQVDFIFDRIIEYFSDRESKHVPDWIAEVKDYIGLHFQQPDLSIANISELKNISVSYLSRTFKKYEGMGLLDYIHKIRLEKAKELMNADMNIKNIALQVGYLESKALIRSFKRYEGITPGRFKEASTNKQVR